MILTIRFTEANRSLILPLITNGFTWIILSLLMCEVYCLELSLRGVCMNRIILDYWSLSYESLTIPKDPPPYTPNTYT